MPKARQEPIKIPIIRKKLIEEPACPLNLSSTSFGANPKHNVTPIPLVSPNKRVKKSIKTLVTFTFQPNPS